LKAREGRTKEFFFAFEIEQQRKEEQRQADGIKVCIDGKFL